MMEPSECINLVQSAPPMFARDAPLVLIHDGGGTAVSYYYLESLNRTVYGIQNPRFYSGEEWEGGLLEMAQLYAKMILSVVPSGPLLLGGWSLGGLLSLEVANILKRTSDINILGIVMIDSICPLAIPKVPNPNIVPSQPIFSEQTRPETRANVSRCFQQAYSNVVRWVPPVWSGCEDEDSFYSRAELEKKVSATLCNGSSKDASSGTNGSGATDRRIAPRSDTNALPSPPKVVLLRCDEYIPVPKNHNPDAISRVDVTREFKKLGWEKYGYDIIMAVLHIPGHHFNIFFEENLDELTARINQACKLLERGF